MFNLFITNITITVINRLIHNTWVELWFGMMIDPSYAWPKMRSEGRRSFRQSRLIWIWAHKRAVKNSRTYGRTYYVRTTALNSNLQKDSAFMTYDSLSYLNGYMYICNAYEMSDCPKKSAQVFRFLRMLTR